MRIGIVLTVTFNLPFAKIEAAAESLCSLLPPMLATQQALGASLPQFRPYATMTESDIADCRNHHKGTANVSVSSANISSEIRDNIRQNIHDSVQARRDDEASRADAAATQKSPSPL